MAITISNGYTFPNGGVVTPTRLNSAATTTITAGANTLVGAVSSGAVTEISCTSAGRALLDDADAAAQRTTLGLGSAATDDTGDFEASGAVSTHAAVTSGVHGISAFAATLLDDASASASRTTLGLGTMSTQAASAVAITGGAVRYDGVAFNTDTLTYDSNLLVNFIHQAAAMAYQTVTLAGNASITAYNVTTGSTKVLRIICDGTTRSLTFPSWTFVGGAAPSTIAAGKIALLKMTAFGTSDSDMIAEYQVQP